MVKDRFFYDSELVLQVYTSRKRKVLRDLSQLFSR